MLLQIRKFKKEWMLPIYGFMLKIITQGKYIFFDALCADDASLRSYSL